MKKIRWNICRRLTVLFLFSLLSVFLISCEKAETKQEKFDINAPEIKSMELSSEGIKISWKEIEGVNNFRVFRKTEDEDWIIIGDSNETSFVDGNVSENSKYTYTVRCLDETGEKYISDYNEEGKTVVYVFCDTPVLSSVRIKGDAVEVKWKAVEGAECYRVFRKEEGGKWGRIADTEELYFEDEEVEIGGKYIYTVRCLNPETNEYVSGYDPQGLSIEYVFYDNPVLSKVEAVNEGVKISWEEVKGVSNYRVFRRHDEESWEKIADTSSNAYIDKEAKKGTVYSYTVRCISEDGRSYLSNYDIKGLTIDYK